jgi:hypothetical protein
MKKFLTIIALAGVMTACNSADDADNKEDSTVDAIDSTADAKTDAIDSTADARIDSVQNANDSLNK